MLSKRLNIKTIAYLSGIILLILGIMCLFPFGVSVFYHENEYRIFLLTAVFFSLLGSTFAYIFKDNKIPLSKRASQMAVGFLWFVIPLFCSLPYMFFPEKFSLTDALFESYSGFTTTGSTVIDNFDGFPKGLLLYRSMTQWIGGFGFSLIIILVLKKYSGSLSNFFDAEFFSVNSNKLYPHIRKTVLQIFLIYFLLTTGCTIGLLLGDMNWLEAVCHALGTVSTGGFSVFNSNAGGFSPYSQWVVMTFMFLSGISYFLIIRIFKRQLKSILEDEQFRVYILLILITSVCFVAYWTLNDGVFVPEKIRQALFTAVSIISTTGYDLHINNPGAFVGSALIVLMFVGGCSASSSTGLKIIRAILLVKYTSRASVRFFHPHAVIPVKYNSKAVSTDSIRRVFSFFFLYLIIFIAGVFLLTLFDNNLSLSIAMSMANLGNIGPVVGSYSSSFTYSMLNIPSQITLIVLMLIGRLEIFSFFILFSKSSFRRI